MSDTELNALAALVNAEALGQFIRNRRRLDEGLSEEWTGPTALSERLELELRRRGVLQP